MIIQGLRNLLSKLPGTENVKVFLGASIIIGGSAVPVFTKEEKRGHDLFSQERPEAVLHSQEQAMKDFDRKAREERQ